MPLDYRKAKDGKLTEWERVEVEHWRAWCKGGGKELTDASLPLSDLIAIIDRLTR